MKKLITSLFLVSALFAQTPQTITIVGQTGPQGSTGTPGVAGVGAIVSVGTVTTGSTPSVTNVGTPSVAKFNFVLPQGLPGSQGIQGIPGPQGIQGIPGTGTGTTPSCLTAVGGSTCPINLGGSTGLQQATGGGSLDINPAVVARLLVPNTFAVQQYFKTGISLLTTNRQQICSSDPSVLGTLWYVYNQGTVKDSIQVCLYNGTAYAWVNLY